MRSGFKAKVWVRAWGLESRVQVFRIGDVQSAPKLPVLLGSVDKNGQVCFVGWASEHREKSANIGALIHQVFDVYSSLSKIKNP